MAWILRRAEKVPNPVLAFTLLLGAIALFGMFIYANR